MESKGQTPALFVKAWRHLPIPALGKHVRALGFAWIELPVRPGFPCTPETVETSLPEAVRVLEQEGVRVLNVTADNPLDDERLYAACAHAGVFMNRVMFAHPREENYWDAEVRARRALDTALPLCRRYGFQIGVQNHSGAMLPANAMGLHNLLKSYDPTLVGTVWDPAHNALNGEDPEPALDIVRSHLCVVNLKNAVWRRANAGAEEPARWKPYFLPGPEGLASWPRVAAKLKQMDYRGPVCFSAEYSSPRDIDHRITADLAYARQFFDW